MEHEARASVWWRRAGSARCWVLRRHLLLGGVFLVAAPGLGRLTHPRVGVVVVVVGSGCGGVLSVA